MCTFKEKVNGCKFSHIEKSILMAKATQKETDHEGEYT